VAVQDKQLNPSTHADLEKVDNEKGKCQILIPVIKIYLNVAPSTFQSRDPQLTAIALSVTIFLNSFIMSL
jgi:hypothetical protein